MPELLATKQACVRVGSDLWQVVVQEAEVEGVTPSQLIRDVLRRSLQRRATRRAA